MKIGDNGTFKKFGGTWKFGIFMISRENGTFKKFGCTFAFTFRPTFVVY